MLKRLTQFFLGSASESVSLPIHPDDLDLVSQADLDWLKRQTARDLEMVSNEDNVVRFGAALNMTKDGLSMGEAAERCRKAFPYYYYSLEVRQQDKWQGADALLPAHVKDRVNRAAMRGQFDKSAVEAASTMNAYLRQLIRTKQI